MIMKLTATLLVLAASASALYAQSNPLVTEMKANYNQIKNNILRGAEKMPEADYSFKPAPESRTFGEVVTHIATVQAALCASAKGESRQLDGTKTAKADAVALLKESIDYCDPVYTGLTDAGAMEMGKMFGRDRSKFGILDFNVIHDNEMYGTMAVYLRAKGQVPPSSEPRPGAKK
jgi:DinB superfamily